MEADVDPGQPPLWQALDGGHGLNAPDGQGARAILLAEPCKATGQGR